MINLGKVAGFAVFVVFLFAAFSNWGVPQIEPAPPPVAEEIDLTAMTIDDFVALGERTFNGQGNCLLCHSPVGGRAPVLDETADVIDDRIGDPRYSGNATDLQEYLYESMTDPSAYVVAGFGQAGSGDTISPMPDVTSPSVGLSEPLVLAVIAYLQNLSGQIVTVEIPSGVEDEASDEDDIDYAEPRAIFASVEEIFAEHMCGMCHVIGDELGAIGPDLSAIGLQRDREYLRRSIINPDADIAKGFEEGMMPFDYGELLYANEVEMLVDYLAAQQGAE